MTLFTKNVIIPISESIIKLPKGKKMPTRRLRMKQETKPKVVDRSALLKLNSLVDRIDKMQKDQAQAKVDLALAYQQLEEQLKEAQLSTHSTKKALALYETPGSRSTTTVNVPKFKKVVSEEDFLLSVSVSVAAAKKILSDKEFAAVTDTKAATKKKPQLVVRSLL